MKSKSLACPVCQKAMCEAAGDPVRFAVCQACRGEWVCRRKLNSTVRSVPVETTVRRYEPVLTEAEMGVKYRRCPVCEERMNRRQFMQGSGVIIDECRDHGVWLDAGEQERIVEFARSGGLLEQLHEEEARKHAELLRRPASGHVNSTSDSPVCSSGSNAIEIVLEAGGLVADIVSIIF